MDREEGGRYQRSAAFKVVGHFCSFYKTANKNEQLWPHGKESNFEHLSLPSPLCLPLSPPPRLLTSETHGSILALPPLCCLMGGVRSPLSRGRPPGDEGGRRWRRGEADQRWSDAVWRSGQQGAPVASGVLHDGQAGVMIVVVKCKLVT